jgi:predicted enzyme related to lactoylglutathione lyase
MPQPIVHYEIAAKDLSTLKKFYEDLFDWKITSFGPQMGDYHGIDGKQGAPFGIDGGMMARQEQDTLPSVRLYANVGSADAFFEKAKGMGCPTIMDPISVEGAGIRIALVLDPEGNPIGCVETLAKQ